MGFPVACQVVILPNLFLQFLTAVAIIRAFILTLLGLNTADQVLPQPQYVTRPVSLPAYEIRELLPVVKFSEINESNAGREESCAVCLAEFEAEQEIRRLRNCTHVFHRCCVDRWMDYHQMTCPLCRTPFILPETQDHGSLLYSHP